MKKQKLFKNIFLILIALVVIAAGTALYYFKSYLPGKVAQLSFPQTDGEISLSGLQAPVEIYRDEMGVPQVYAENTHDQFFAQGYVHAQDRFWQMDAWRHIGAGTLSEMFGKSQLETDAFLRTLGWARTAEVEWETADPDSRLILQAYADGVNAYLKDHSGSALSLEYAVLGLLSPDYQVAPWSPVNSLTWGKVIAMDLCGNMDDEIERALLLKTLSPEQLAELYPAYDLEKPVIVNQLAGTPASLGSLAPQAQALAQSLDYTSAAHNIALLQNVLSGVSDGIGSNSWVVSGSLTDTGKPLLANDPHLGIQMPSIWYQVGLHCTSRNADCQFDVSGFSFAGVPGVVIGHNERIAWGYTNVGTDVMDLYIEKVNPDNPNQYEVNGEWVDFETRSETFNTGSADPVTITVRVSRHGPIISDSFAALMDQNAYEKDDFVPFRENSGIDLPANYAIALQWTALSPSSIFNAIWGLDKAQNWEEFRIAASKFQVPAQNLVYADVDGNIGYQMPGNTPIRAGGNGSLPVPGWTDAYEWTGFVPFEAQPYAFNPPEGYIVTANNPVVSAAYPYLITTDWDYGFRADRITSLIEAAPAKIDIAYIAQMQADNLEPNASVFVPLLAEAGTADLTATQADFMAQLSNWDGQAAADSAPAAFFESFWKHLLQDTFNDDLPEERAPEGGSRWNQVMRNLPADSPWWDDQTTSEVVENRADMVIRARGEALQELEKSLGKEPAAWRWGDLHTATFRNQTLGKSGIALIESLFNRGGFPVGGSSSIVNATGWSLSKGYEVKALPSMRMIVDLSDLNNSVTVNTTGQSGHAYHSHYIDMAPLWASVQYYPMLWGREQVLQNQSEHLVLNPAR